MRLFFITAWLIIRYMDFTGIGYMIARYSVLRYSRYYCICLLLLLFGAAAGTGAQEIQLTDQSVATYLKHPAQVGVLSLGETDSRFYLVSGEGSTDNSYFSIEGDTLKTSRTFSEPGAYSIRVMAVSEEDIPYERAFEITVVPNPYPMPFTLTGSKIEKDSVDIILLDISGNSDTSALHQNPDAVPESLIVVAKGSGYPDRLNESGVNTISYPLTLLSDSGYTLSDTVSPELLSSGSDSVIYISALVFWDVNGSDSLTNLLRQDTVQLIDKYSYDNPMSVTGSYRDSSEYADITLTGVSDVFSSGADTVKVTGSIDENSFEQPLFDTSIIIDEMEPGTETIEFEVQVGTRPIEQDTVYIQSYLKSWTGKIGVPVETSLVIGWERPVFTGSVNASALDSVGSVKLEWEPITGADSVRIWYNKDIPVKQGLPKESDGYNVKYLDYQQVIDPDSNSCVIENLLGGTPYYFAIQYISGGMWSLVNSYSSDSALTVANTGDPIENTLSIDTLWFDSTLNEFKLDWSLDTSVSDSGEFLINYSFGLNPEEVAQVPQSLMFNVERTSSGTLSISPPDDFVFDTTYYAGLWLSVKYNSDNITPPSSPGPLSTDSIDFGKLSWQQVQYFSGNNPFADTVSTAFNDLVYLKWKKSYMIGPLEDTLYVYDYADEGVEMPEDLVDPGVIGVRFKRKLPSPPFMFGINTASVPEEYKGKTGLFRIDEQGGVVPAHDTELKNGILWTEMDVDNRDQPIIMLADTVPTTFEMLSDTGSIAEPSVKIEDSVLVHAGIAGAKWTLKYGNGRGGYETVNTGYCDTTDEMLELIISGRAVSSAYGLRAILIISDGVNRDTLNLSRRVKTPNSDAFFIPEEKWVPVHAIDSLHSNEARNILPSFSESDSLFGYDNTQLRVFRWMDSSLQDSLSDTGSGYGTWVEYSTNNNAVREEFSFKPGRLFWIKTRNSFTIELDTGVTPSLKDTFQIRCSPGKWTDFALPYRFDIFLKDICRATGEDASHLDFCHWVESEEDGIYSAERIYTPAIDSSGDKLDNIILKNDQTEGGYTLYNNSDTEVILRIPPVSKGLSVESGEGVSKKRAEKPGLFSDPLNISLEYLSDKGGKGSLQYCLRDGLNETGAGPVTPSFYSHGAGIYSEETGTLSGYKVESKGHEQGGKFIVAFYNNGSQERKIHYSINDPFSGRSYSVKVYNRGDEVDSDKDVVTVEPGKRVYRTVAFGGDDYFNKNSFKFDYSINRMYPNPFRRGIRVRYTVPAGGLRDLKFRLYDISGRLIRNISLRGKSLRTGIHTAYLDLKGIASGLYLIRMESIDNNGDFIMTSNKKIMCVR